MPDLIVPADGEQAVIDELSSTFIIGTSINDPMPDLFLRVVAAGGTQLNMVTDQQLMLLESFAPRETLARAQLSTALALLQYGAERKGALGSETCYRLRAVSSLANFQLPSVPDRKRYVVTISADLRRRSVTI